MRFGSLFAGIGGFDIGLERAGMECAWQVEKDPFCRKILGKHWPDVPKFEDVCDCGAGNLESVDVICGGFPCQDISSAGNGAGIDGKRSGLWSQYVRIIREIRPRYVLVENVSALIVRGLDRVLGDLAESGYDAEWCCLPASLFGALHRRNRFLAVAHPMCDGWEQDDSVPRVLGSMDIPTSKMGNVGPCQTVTTRARSPGVPLWADPEQAGTDDPDDPGWIMSGEDRFPSDPESGVDRIVDGIPEGLDRRIKSLGNAIYPPCAEWLGRAVMRHATSQMRGSEE